MAMGPNPEGNCCYGHKAGDKMHQLPMVKGKPFSCKEHRRDLVELGLTVQRKELKEEMKAGKPIPGVPKKVGAALVYPARHFG